MKPTLLRTLLLVCMVSPVWVSTAGAEAPAGDYPRHIRPFLDKHCIDCHGADTAKAGLRLDSLAPEFSAVEKARIWTKVLDRLEADEMPPKKRARPARADREQVAGWISEQLLKADQVAQPPPGSLTVRRLTRLQYENAVHDLLAIDLPLKERLPEDTRVLGFDNVGEALELSPKQMEAYLEAADAALDAAVIKRSRPQTWKRRFSLLELLSPEDRGRLLDLEDVGVLFGGQFGMGQYSQNVKDEGRYRFRLAAYAYQNQGDPLGIAVHSGNLRLEKRELIGHFDAPPDAPAVIEFECRLDPGSYVDFRLQMPEYGPKPRNLKDHRGQGLAVQWLEIEGPLIDSWPPASHRHLFGDLPLQLSSRGSKDFTVVSESPQHDAERLLMPFLRRAWRRPVGTTEVKPFVNLVNRQLDKKKTFEQAMRVGYKAILCSPGFLFFHDYQGQADDFALASRLSYFLWNRQPDDELMQLAEGGALSQPKVLHAQVERLLSHPNARAFVDNFVSQWLEVRLIDFTVPDKKLYPEFGEYDRDALLRESIIREPQLYFAELLKQDLSLTQFIDSDFALLNDRLARHYGIPGVKGCTMRVVKLPPGSHRGGVLTQASILKVTANGSTTSPVVRGAWVLRNIVGKPSDPPPPNAGAIEPDIHGAKTIRELLDIHRHDSACARCHVKIDPLGFALENFDVMGRWREKYRVMTVSDKPRPTDGPRIDASYRFPDDREIRDIDDLKKYLLENKDQLARALAEKLLIYGTGRQLRFCDRAAVNEIVSQARTSNYGLRSLIHEIVQSRLFLNP